MYTGQLSPKKKPKKLNDKLKHRRKRRGKNKTKAKQLWVPFPPFQPLPSSLSHPLSSANPQRKIKSFLPLIRSPNQSIKQPELMISNCENFLSLFFCIIIFKISFDLCRIKSLLASNMINLRPYVSFRFNSSR